MNAEYPDISCVVIGLNCGCMIRRCLEAIGKMRYPKKIEIIYVDGGSVDESVIEARSVSGVKIVELDHDNPTPGKGRNVGWRLTNSTWIHFFDGDTIPDAEWLSTAVQYAADQDIGAIFGQRRELYPEKNWFHRIADREWLKPDPNSEYFGGDVLIRRSVLEKVGGYDETLWAGEDPELSVRVKKNGWKICGINVLMCHHDINISNFRQYWSRSVRTGYGYAAGGLKMLKNGNNSFFVKMVKVMIKVCMVLFLILLWAISSKSIWLYAAFLIFFYPFISMIRFCMKGHLKRSDYLMYGLHCSIAPFPQFLGVAKYFLKGILSHRLKTS